MQTTTKSSLPAIGTAFAGGFFAGLINASGKQFALIVSPSEGDHPGTEWNSSFDEVEGAKSFCDGLENTNAMAEAGSEIASWVRSLRIADQDDWYIPSRDELELLYRNLKPTTHANYASYRDGENPSSSPAGYAYTKQNPQQTSTEEFQANAEHALHPVWYWSSTQSSSYSRYAWMQYFTSGNQHDTLKGLESRVRAVRRLLVIE